ncbi:hypothetical protein ACQCVP_07345 [Rossellomorea vietnamensis]|uniref:hypothetical protein n=1 Tax=Rossellomorea vietnamensis TaxID=218284 RepID=UPI003CFB9C7E
MAVHPLQVEQTKRLADFRLQELLSPIREKPLSIRGYPKATIYAKTAFSKMKIQVP